MVRFPAIRFLTTNGLESDGYRAETVVDILDLVLTARDTGGLTASQLRIAHQCEILVRSFAKVGVVALIDEVSGYQENREKSGLQKILDRFLAKELSRWAKCFPDEFYKEMHHLKGWEYNPKGAKRPGCVAHYTVDLVYDRLAPDLVEELKKKAPAKAPGRRSSKFHQWMSADFGHPRLQMHLYAITKMMTSSGSWESFMLSVNRSFPKVGDTALLPFFAEDIEAEE